MKRLFGLFLTVIITMNLFINPARADINNQNMVELTGTIYADKEMEIVDKILNLNPDGVSFSAYEFAEFLGTEVVNNNGIISVSPSDIYSVNNKYGFSPINSYTMSRNDNVVYYKVFPNINYNIDDYDRYVQQIISELGINNSTTKEEAIYLFNQYICNNFTYDLTYTNNNDFIKFLNDKKGVCRHFAVLFESLCDSCGIECDYVSGYNELSSTGHAWNRVVLNGQTLYVDTTWNLESADKDLYLLIDEDTFNLSHGMYK